MLSANDEWNSKKNDVWNSNSKKIVLVGDKQYMNQYPSALNSAISLAAGEMYYSEVTGELLMDGYFNGKTRIEIINAGQIDFDRVRSLCYPLTSSFIILFNRDDSVSFDRVRSLWVPELKHYKPDTPILLVGITEKIPSVTNQNIARYVKEQKLSYLECCLDDKIQVLNVYSQAVKLTLDKESLDRFNASTDKMKKLLKPREGLLSEEELRTLSRRDATNTTFFKKMPNEIFALTENYYLCNKRMSEGRVVDNPSNRALIDAGCYKPPIEEKTAVNQQSKTCRIM